MEPDHPLITERQTLYLEVLAFNFLQHARYDHAYTLYETLKSLHPQESKYHLAEAYLHLNNNRLKEALAASQSAEKLAKSFNMRYFGCLISSKALWKLGHQEEAQQNLVNFLKIHRDTDPKAVSTPHN